MLSVVTFYFIALENHYHGATYNFGYMLPPLKSSGEIHKKQGAEDANQQKRVEKLGPLSIIEKESHINLFWFYVKHYLSLKKRNNELIH